MSQHLLTLGELKESLPKHLRTVADQDLVDKVNNLAMDPETADMVRENFVTYTKVLTEGRFRMDDYLNAIKYCTYKIMGYSNKDAWVKTFPDRYDVLVLKGTSDKDISAHVSAFHRNKMVNAILEQATIPVWLLNQDAYQKAINVQLELMISANSEKVRTDAANSLLTHLKAPEKQKIEMEVSVKREGGIADLMESINALAVKQKELIAGGVTAKEIGSSNLFEHRKEEAEDAVYVDVVQALPAPTPAPVPTPVPEPVLVPAPAPTPALVSNPFASLFTQDLEQGQDFLAGVGVVEPKKEVVPDPHFEDDGLPPWAEPEFVQEEKPVSTVSLFAPFGSEE